MAGFLLQVCSVKFRCISDLLSALSSFLKQWHVCIKCELSLQTEHFTIILSLSMHGWVVQSPCTCVSLWFEVSLQVGIFSIAHQGSVFGYNGQCQVQVVGEIWWQHDTIVQAIIFFSLMLLLHVWSFRFELFWSPLLPIPRGCACLLHFESWAHSLAAYRLKWFLTPS